MTEATQVRPLAAMLRSIAIGLAPNPLVALSEQVNAMTPVTAALSGETKGSASPTQHSCYSHAEKLASSACLLRQLATRQEIQNGQAQK